MTSCVSQNVVRAKQRHVAIGGDVKADDIVPPCRKGARSLGVARGRDAETAGHRARERPSRDLSIGQVPCQSNTASPKPARAHSPEQRELNVVNATLGGGFSGRLFQIARKAGLDLRRLFRIRDEQIRRAFEASAETRNEVTIRGIKETLAEMKRLREPARARRRTPNSSASTTSGNYLLLARKNASRNAKRVQDIDLYGLAPDYYKRYAKRMDLDALHRAATRAANYISIENVAILRGRRGEGD